MPTALLVTVAVLVLTVLAGVLVVLVLTVRRTGDAVHALSQRLDQLDARAGRLHGELSAVDDGLADVAAALAEHRPPAREAADADAADAAEITGRDPGRQRST